MVPEFIIEPRRDKVEKITFLCPLNIFVPLKVKNEKNCRRYFWKEKLLVYEATFVVESEAEVDGEKGYEVVEKRKGEGITAELRSYYGEKEDEWVLRGEIFRRSDGILRINTSLQNGFPRILKKGEPFISNGRRFELVGSFNLLIGGKKYPCIKVIMKKEYQLIGQKGLIEFYLRKDGQLLFKANYHPKEEYSTISYEHSVIVEGEEYGILHCSILSSLLRETG